MFTMVVLVCLRICHVTKMAIIQALWGANLFDHCKTLQIGCLSSTYIRGDDPQPRGTLPSNTSEASSFSLFRLDSRVQLTNPRYRANRVENGSKTRHVETIGTISQRSHSLATIIMGGGWIAISYMLSHIAIAMQGTLGTLENSR